MRIENWFSTPIYYNVATNFDQLQNEIESCYDQINFTKHKSWGGKNHSLSDPEFGDNIIEKYDLKILKLEIETQIKNYISLFGDTKYNININDCWITNTSPGEHTVVHNHGDTTISGVYYFKTNTKDGNIYFLNPNTSLMTSYYANPDDYVEYPPAPGLFILFPGWLYHGVRSNDTEENRISVSFNVGLFKGNDI